MSYRVLGTVRRKFPEDAPPPRCANCELWMEVSRKSGPRVLCDKCPFKHLPLRKPRLLLIGR